MAIAEEFIKEIGIGFTDFLIVLGLLYCLRILGWVWNVVYYTFIYVIKPCCYSRGRLYKMYGINKFKSPADQNQSALSATQLSGADESSWAIVTGGSDGLGLAQCKKLAREGFNICIVSRTASKINEKLDEIR